MYALSLKLSKESRGSGRMEANRPETWPQVAHLQVIWARHLLADTLLHARLTPLLSKVGRIMHYLAEKLHEEGGGASASLTYLHSETLGDGAVVSADI